MIDKNTVIQLVPVDLLPKAIDVPTDDPMAIFRLATKMEKLCTEEDGIGLSAVQVGIPWNFFILRRGRYYEYYLNCEYTGLGPKQNSIEGCLSLKNTDGTLKRFECQRYAKIRVKGKQLRFTNVPALVISDFDEVQEGLYSVVFQHEIDHGNDILISQIGKEIEFIR